MLLRERPERSFAAEQQVILEVAVAVAEMRLLPHGVRSQLAAPGRTGRAPGDGDDLSEHVICKRERCALRALDGEVQQV